MAQDAAGPALAFTLDGRRVAIEAPAERLSAHLRERAGARDVKIGCNAGDCGACTVLLDGLPVCACTTAAGQAAGRRVETPAGLVAADPVAQRLAAAFEARQAAQCGICTPGMIASATALLRAIQTPTEAEVMDALGGVLCRCTGYRKIVAAVLDAAAPASGEATGAASRHPGGPSGSIPHPVARAPTAGEGDGSLRPAGEAAGATPPRPDATDRATAAPSGIGGAPGTAHVPGGGAVGAALPRVDGRRKVDGTEAFGDDVAPPGALLLRIVRSPHHRAAFAFGDLAAWRAAHPGVAAVLTAADVPGENRFGVIPGFEDQPVLAEREARFRGEAVAVVVGERATVEALDLATFPVVWTPLPAALTPPEALAAPPVQSNRESNEMCRGHVRRGDADAAIARAAHVAEGSFGTAFVEHAYIEPEAGFARVVGDRIEVHCCTQAPFMNRDGIARIMGLPPEGVRIVPTATGGGFGSKLDLSLQPFLALAARATGRPVRGAYTRSESIRSTTKRHPAEIRLRVGADADGRLAGFDFEGTFNTGAYASWGPTVATRVPIHASGPYRIADYRARSLAVLTNCAPAGAFRGFGVPQSAVAQEALFDELADACGLDRLEFRLRNALRPGDPTVTGQVFDTGVGFAECLEALRPRWLAALAEAAEANAPPGPLRRGVGIAGGWYGCGNTSLPNPSTVRAGIRPDGRVVLHQGAADIGQGANTVIAQIFAQALGVPVSALGIVGPDTDLTPDAGKTSASRQTYVTGNAARLCGERLRADILRLGNVSPEARIETGAGHLRLIDGATRREVALASLSLTPHGYALEAEATYDPPTAPLDAEGQGSPYAVFGYAAQMCELEVDDRLGTVRLLRFTAAHDVGRAINPLLVEGQVEGGIAQGIGMALMEAFVPGRTENLHDYLIPTIGDVPPVETLIVESGDAHGPYGAKGLGEHSLIPTAPAILNAIRHATGAHIRQLPATPDRVLAAIREAGG